MTVILKMSFGLDDTAPTRCWERAYAYLDEQLYDATNPESDSFAVGMLIVPDPIGAEVIAEAMAQLTQNSRVRRRGHFHAKDDGPDARLALARVFARRIPAFQFRAFRWRPEMAVNRSGPASAAELHMHVASIGLGLSSARVRGEMQVEYAAVDTLELAAFRGWMDEQDDVRMDVMLGQGGVIPTRFPHYPVEERTPATSPGIQIADLLLWTQRLDRMTRRNRKRRKHADRVFGAARMRCDMEATQQAGPMQWYEYERNPAGPVVQRPHPHLDGLTAERRDSLLVAIEGVMHRLARAENLPDHVAHLMGRVRSASESLHGILTADCEVLTRFLRAFLFVADTLPVYSPDDENGLQLAADAIGVACELQDLRETRTISLLDRWVRVRRFLATSDPTQLGWRTSS